MNVNDIFKSFNSSDLQQINNFLNSSQGKNMTSDLTDKHKKNILEQFMRLDAETVKNKLNGISKEDILKLLK